MSDNPTARMKDNGILRAYGQLSALVRRHWSAIASIGMIASANLSATVLGLVGSLVQAHFISPDDLGYIRKYSVISSYAIFLSLGLFTIVQREYCVLIGKSEKEGAYRVAAIAQSWCIIVSLVVCTVLSVPTVIAALQGNWREASAWFIQIVSVWTLLYGGYLICTYQSGQHFKGLANGTFLSALSSVLVLPLFAVFPFTGLVTRSVVGPMVSTWYLHHVRPVKVGWRFRRKEFLDLAKRGMRLFVGTYVRYHFWLTVEIWLVLFFAGDAGVGLFIFSSVLVTGLAQAVTAINQVYIPRLAEAYGRTNSLVHCLKLSLKPAVASIIVAALLTLITWIVIPPALTHILPKYIAAIPMVNVLVLDTFIIALSAPIYMISVLEDYTTQTIAAVGGILLFVGLSLYLHSLGMNEMAVIWGTLVGRVGFVVISLFALGMRSKFYSSLTVRRSLA